MLGCGKEVKDRTGAVCLPKIAFRKCVCTSLALTSHFQNKFDHLADIRSVIFNQNPSFSSHIKEDPRVASFHLCNFAKDQILSILNRFKKKKKMSWFVPSRPNYCNSLLFGCPSNSVKTLQLSKNAAFFLPSGTSYHPNRTFSKCRLNDNFWKVVLLPESSSLVQNLEVRLMLIGKQVYFCFLVCSPWFQALPL